jgi:hypothetical protein
MLLLVQAAALDRCSSVGVPGNSAKAALDASTVRCCVVGKTRKRSVSRPHSAAPIGR